MIQGSVPSIALLTCMWKRPLLTELIFRHYAGLRENLQNILDLHLVAVGSESDASRELAQRHGFVYIEHPNSPLGAKWNRGMEAVRACGADAMLVVGSDDLIDENLFTIYAQRLIEGFLFVGLADTYFWDLASRRLALWHGYPPPRRGEPIGLGRLIHRKLLSEMAWRPWADHLENGLDRSMMFKLAPLLESQADLDRITVLSCRQSEIAPVDVKTSENMWGFEETLMHSMAFDIQDDIAVLGRRYNSDILAGLLKLSGLRRPSLPTQRSFAPSAQVAYARPAGEEEPLRGLSVLVVTASPPHELESPSAMRAMGLTALSAGAGARSALISLFPGIVTEGLLTSRVPGATFLAAPNGENLAAQIDAQSPDVIMVSGPMTPGQSAALLEAMASSRSQGRTIRLVRDTPVLVGHSRRETFDALLNKDIDAILVQDPVEKAFLLATGTAPTGPVVVAPPFFPELTGSAPFEARRNLCFAGNLLDPSLRSRIRLFIRRGLPLIREAYPKTLFSIFTFLPGHIVHDLAGDGVVYASDMRDISRAMTLYTAFISFEKSYVGACEGFQGLAMAWGMPVVTGSQINAFQASGPGERYLNSSPAEMAQTCLALLSNATLWNKTSDQARAMVGAVNNSGLVLDGLVGLALEWRLLR